MNPRIPGVTLIEEIGVGGFATVYRGMQTIIGRDVAVKVDSRKLADERDRRRFEREITAAGRVSAHPNIVSLYDAGINDDGRPYLVMELYTGGSYGGRMKTAQPLPVSEILDVGIAIADALAAAHDEGILHRDVKPGNILISRYGIPALADFGLAALPRPGAEASVTLEALTPAYSAPESFALTPPSAQTDIFGLGTTLYALLKGGPPRSDPSGASPSLPHLLFLLNQPLPALDARPDATQLMQVIWRATATLPQDRYATAAEMRDDLMLLKAGYPIVRPRTPQPVSRPTPEPPGPATGPTATEPPTTITGRRPADPGPEHHRPPPAGKSRRVLYAVIAVVVLLIGTTAAIVIPQMTGTTPTGTARASTAPTSAVSTSAGSTGTLSTTTATSPTEDPNTTTESPSEESPSAQPPPVGQCFAGLVTISGSRTAEPVSSCTTSHYWEAFATGVLDPATISPTMSEVLLDTNVLTACTQEALSEYLGDQAAAGTYTIEVLPPREALFYQDEKGFYCLAALEGAGEVATSIRGS